MYNGLKCTSLTETEEPGGCSRRSSFPSVLRTFLCLWCFKIQDDVTPSTATQRGLLSLTTGILIRIKCNFQLLGEGLESVNKLIALLLGHNILNQNDLSRELWWGRQSPALGGKALSPSLVMPLTSYPDSSRLRLIFCQFGGREHWQEMGDGLGGRSQGICPSLHLPRQQLTLFNGSSSFP